jgi:hypothetical protein
VGVEDTQQALRYSAAARFHIHCHHTN